MNELHAASDEQEIEGKEVQVWITRRRWDGFFLVAFPLAALIGALAYPASTGIANGAIKGAASIAVIWAIVRWSWPQGGAAVPTLSGVPGTIPRLWWLSTWGLLVGLGAGTLLHVLVPIPVTTESWNIRSLMIWVGFALVWFVGLLVGLSRIERAFGTAPTCDDRDIDQIRRFR